MFVFLGGGGAGLSAIANIFFDIGFKNIIVVDSTRSQITEKLQAKGIKVIIGDNIYDYKKDDVIIYSDAVVNSKDFQKIKNNVKFTYFELVGEISKWFQTIAIAGTHGKTSTTALMITAGKNLGFKDLALGIVGGFVPDLSNNNYYINIDYKEDIKTIFEKIFTKKGNRPVHLFKKYYFIVEADEFNRHFLLLDSTISCITKLDHDHKDVYKTKKEYLKAFDMFKNKTRGKIFEQSKIKTYNIDFDYVFGDHMQKNASLVIEVFKTFGYKEQDIIDSLKSFKGIRRRQEYLGKIKDLDIYTDYAHHPVELNVVLKAFKEHFQQKKIIGIFQAHQVFRFVSYKKDFIEVLKKFDELILYNIYSVREEKLLKEITGKNLSVEEQKKIVGEDIAKQTGGTYIEDFQKLINTLENKKGIGIILTAGDLDYKIRNFIKKTSHLD